MSTGTALSGGMVISVAGFLSQALVILYGLAIGVVDLDVDSRSRARTPGESS